MREENGYRAGSIDADREKRQERLESASTLCAAQATQQQLLEVAEFEKTRQLPNRLAL